MKRSSSLVASVLILLVCGCESPPVTREDATRPRPDAGIPPEPECYPPYTPGTWQYTRTWEGAELLAVAFGPDGSLGVAARFTGQIDLDPGEGTLPFTGEPSRTYELVARLDPEGVLAWAHVLDERLGIGGLTVTADGDVAITGPIRGDARTTIDLDPGPGVSEHTLRLYDRGIYALALDPTGALRWARPVSWTTAGSQVAGIDARSDGTVVLMGTLASDPSSWDPSDAPDATPRGYEPFYWQLAGDGTTVVVFPVPRGIRYFEHGADDSLVILGDGLGRWDADYTYGVDVQDTGAVFATEPAQYITALAPDLTYRWSRSVYSTVGFAEVAIDPAARVYVFGGAGLPAAAGDIDPTEEGRRWQRGTFLAQWTPEGEYAWSDPPWEGQRLLLANELGSYMVDLGRLVAHDPDGRWRWVLMLEAGRPTFLEGGPERRIVLAGQYSETLDHASSFGAAPDPHVASTNEGMGDAFVTVFTDAGGAAERCEEWPLEELPTVDCTMARAIVCGDLPAECGRVTSPCGGETLDCGECAGPEVCGAEGAASQCGREGVEVLAAELPHPLHVEADDTHVYFTTQGDYGPILVPAPYESPVREALGVWRVPRDGSAPAERIYSERARPLRLFVTEASVLVWTRESTLEGEYRVAVIPKSDPASAAHLDTGDPLTAVIAAEDGWLYYGVSNDLLRIPETGGIASVFIAGCVPPRLIFEGTEVLYACAEIPGYASVRSRPRGGGSETQRSHAMEMLSLEWASAESIVFTARTLPGAVEWLRVARDAPSPPAGEHLAFQYDTDVPAIGRVAAFDGSLRYNLFPGPLSARTRGGQLLASPFDAAAPRARLAARLNHPVNLWLDDRDLFIAEEGSLGMYTHDGRILRYPR